MTAEQDQREAFEAWFKTKNPATWALSRKAVSPDEYASGETAIAYAGWSAQSSRIVELEAELAAARKLMGEAAHRVETEISCCDGFGMVGAHENGCLVSRLRAASTPVKS